MTPTTGLPDQKAPGHSMPKDPGAALARRARAWWQDEWRGKAAMAIGMQDPVLDPTAMQGMAEKISGCAKPRELPEWGHFVPEYGADLARWALVDF